MKDKKAFSMVVSRRIGRRALQGKAPQKQVLFSVQLPNALCMHLPLFLSLSASYSVYQPDANKLSSSRKYSPQSACRNATTPVGSSRLASAVARAVMPKPSGVSFML